MCGRFVLESPDKILSEEFRVNLKGIDIKPRYNIAPGQPVLVIIGNDERKGRFCSWGLIPPWEETSRSVKLIINARGETLTIKPMFRSAFKKQRCLLPADGFFEWAGRDRNKTPFFVRLGSGKPFTMAGLYFEQTFSGNKSAFACAIVTTEANELLRPIHDRMPVIIEEKDRDLWLDTGINEESLLVSLFKPFPREEMVCHEVSSLVNSPAFDSPENIRSVSDIGSQGLFAQ